MERRISPVRVSKLLSLILRHRPEEFGVSVDRYGFADLDELLSALKREDDGFEMADVEAVVYNAEKSRFEIQEGRIRARYGHSFPVEMSTDPTTPPEFLYKGVSPGILDRVLDSGLRPTDRQYVHLSFDADVAALLGSRRGMRGAVVRVEARRAHEAGVHFYDCGPTVLTERVPAEFLAIEERPESPEETVVPTPARAVPREEPREQDDSPPPTYGRRRKFGTRR